MELSDVCNDKLLAKVVSYGLPFMFERISTDSWYFCLMLDNGMEIGVSCLNDIVIDSFGNVWLDVKLLEGDFDNRFKGAPSSRTRANINLKKVVAIYEIADT